MDNRSIWACHWCWLLLLILGSASTWIPKVSCEKFVFQLPESVGAYDEQVVLWLSQLCANYHKTFKLTHVSQVEQIIGYLEKHPNVVCRGKLVRDAILDLKRVLAYQQDGNVCRLEKVELLRQYHDRWISTEKQSKQLPRALVKFVIAYGLRLSLACKQNLVQHLASDTARYIGENPTLSANLGVQLEPRQVKFLDALIKRPEYILLPQPRPLEIKPGESADKIDDEMREVAAEVEKSEREALESADGADDQDEANEDQGAADGATDKVEEEEKEEEPVVRLREEEKIYLKSPNAQTIRRIQALCRRQLKPIYDHLIAPIVRLADFGFNYVDASIDQQMRNLVRKDQAREWYRITFVCEAILSFEVFDVTESDLELARKQHGLKADAHIEARKLIRVLSEQEASELRSKRETAAELVVRVPSVNYGEQEKRKVRVDDQLIGKKDKMLNWMVRKFYSLDTKLQWIRSRAIRLSFMLVAEKVKRDKLTFFRRLFGLGPKMSADASELVRALNIYIRREGQKDAEKHKERDEFRQLITNITLGITWTSVLALFGVLLYIAMTVG